MWFLIAGEENMPRKDLCKEAYSRCTIVDGPKQARRGLGCKGANKAGAPSSEMEDMKEPHRAERGCRGVFLVELYTCKFRQGYHGRGQKNF